LACGTLPFDKLSDDFKLVVSKVFALAVAERLDVRR
jgi:hypothetical protein